jgi:hypothetical protein
MSMRVVALQGLANVRLADIELPVHSVDVDILDGVASIFGVRDRGGLVWYCACVIVFVCFSLCMFAFVLRHVHEHLLQVFVCVWFSGVRSGHVAPQEDDTRTRNEEKKTTGIQEWEKHSAAVRAELGVPLRYSPWTSQPHITLSGISKGSEKRCRDLIDVAWCARLAANPQADWSELARGFYVDISQSVHMRPWRLDRVMTLCRGTVVYSYEGDMVLRGKHNLASLGMPASWGRHLTNASAQQLAGQAFAAPCIATATMAYFLNSKAPWWTGNGA